MLKEKQNELIKGFYSLFNNYGSPEKNNLNIFEKKGSEIKSGIDSVLTQVRKSKTDALDNMEKILSDLDFSPNKECDEYNEYKHLIGYLPKKFDFNIIYSGEPYINTDSGIEKNDVKVPDPVQKSEMREYNESVIKYIDMCVTALKLESLKRNIQDNKTYSLNVEQLSILGL
jgi:hypothetical protein